VNPMDHQLLRLPSWLVGPQTPAEWESYMAVYCSGTRGGDGGGGSVSVLVVGEEESRRKNKKKRGHWRNLQHVHVIASQRTTR
jgi:hypothetical protein